MKQIKKLVMLLLCCCMALGIFTISATASETDEIPVEETEFEKIFEETLEINKLPLMASSSDDLVIVDAGYCGSNVVWGITDDGILLIVGTGYMNNYTASNVPWAAYRNYIGGVLVSDGVLNIGNNAFANCNYLSIVLMLDDGVKSIGEGAFENCKNLLEIYFPNTLTTIGSGAFKACGNLKTVSVPDTVTSVGESAFENCTALSTVKLPKNLTAISASLFKECTNLTAITIPSKVKTIGSNAFYGSGLKTISIPDTVTSVGESAFENCTALSTAKLPKNLTAISASLFKGCANLTAITIPSKVKTIGASAFYGSGLKAIALPEGVTSIGESAFYNCSNLATATLPGSLTTIGNAAFYGCSALKKIAIPEKVVSVPQQAFYGCSSLTSVTIPYGVVNIKASAFEGCTSLTAVRLPKTVKTISEKAFGSCNNLKLTIINEEAAINQAAFAGHGEGLVIRCIENSTAHTFAISNNITYELIDLSLVTEYFADVASGAWYTDAVQYVYDNGIMEGTNESFTPNGNMTRAMFVTTLYRLAGEPEITDRSACEELKDVASGAWYTDAVCWAYSNKITTGYVDTMTFRMNDPLTREQLATFLYRYAQYSELDTTQSDDLSGLLNADQIKAYAVDNVKWAVGAGLISGLEVTDKTGATVYDLAPQGKATRAQMASILMRFCDTYELYETAEL